MSQDVVVCRITGDNVSGFLHTKKDMYGEETVDTLEEALTELADLSKDMETFVGHVVIHEGFRYDTDENVLLRDLLENPDFTATKTPDGIELTKHNT